MDNDKKNNRDWIRMPSKSHPGHFYLFNKITGDTKWLPLKSGEAPEYQKRNSPPKLTINKVSTTPAQDRLKRLQRNLRLSQTKSSTYQNKRHATELKAKTSKEQENELNDEPSTSSAAKSFPKVTKKATKRSLNSLPIEIDNSIKRLKSPILDTPKKLEISDSFKNKSNDSIILEACTEVFKSSKDTTTNNIPGDLENIEDNSSKLNILSSGIVKKLKEICKIPFNMSKKLPQEKLLSKRSTTKFKATRKSKDKQFSTTSLKQEAIVNQIKGEKDEWDNETLQLSKPKNPNTPTYPRGSANSRLERLKQSLLLQQPKQHQPCNTPINYNALNQIYYSSTETNTTTALPLGHSQYSSHNNSTNSSTHTANNTSNDDNELMDWQPILKYEEPTEESSCFIMKKSKKFLLKKDASNESQTMGDIIDTVNENLLRFSAEKEKDSVNNKKKWCNDFYYFVLDTNVLLRYLTFLEDLSNMILCDTNGTILYIPYSVLQELDKLKMRSGLQEGVKTAAIRAIKYLNSKFEKNLPNLQAQSALDERLHLIDINSADDSIINCCLQAKQHVPNLLLLSEDINLRNKAICNNIMVSTKSDLVAKKYDLSDKS